MSASYAPRMNSGLTPAVPPAKPVEQVHTLTLTEQERALLATALLTQSVLLMNASSTQEAAGHFERSGALFYDGYALSKLELRIRNSIPTAS
jgi:hypothetical protein